MQAVGEDRREHEHDRTEQGDRRPGPVCEGIALGGAIGECQEVVEPPVVTEAPDEPEQPEWPEPDEDAQPKAQQIVCRAFDHSAASAATVCSAVVAAATTRRAVPP